MKLIICSVLLFTAVTLTGVHTVEAGLVGKHELLRGLVEGPHGLIGNGLAGPHFPAGLGGFLGRHKLGLPFRPFAHQVPEADAVSSHTVVATETKAAEVDGKGVAAARSAASASSVAV